MVTYSILPSPPSLQQLIRSRLNSWSDVSWCAATQSTNSDLLASARASQPQPRLLGTHLQLGGRGRAGRNFHAEAGNALMFSCSFSTGLPLHALPTLSVTFGMVACESLATLLDDDRRLSMKWPNDVQWNNAKMAGILMETARPHKQLSLRSTSTQRETIIVVGMGLNLRGADRLSQELNRPIADWQMTECQAPADQIVASVASGWHEAVLQAEHSWSAENGLPYLPARYARFDALDGNEINVQDHGQLLNCGTSAGIDVHGRLQVDTAAGRVFVTAGDISVRKAV